MMWGRRPKAKTQHQPKAEAAESHCTTGKRQQKPQSAKRQLPQDKRQHNHPKAQGKKTNTLGGQKPQSFNRQPPTTTTERQKNTQACRWPWAQKTNANRSDQQQRTNTNHSHHEGEKHNRRQCSSAANGALWARGWGVLVGNKPLVLPPGSTPSHAISPSPLAQDPEVDRYLDR